MSFNYDLELPFDYNNPNFDSTIESWKDFASKAVEEIWQELADHQKKALALNFEAMHNNRGW